MTSYVKGFFVVTLNVLFLSLSYAQDIEVYETYDEFEAQLTQNPEKTYVVNFWATWCAPCVKELPHFEELRAAHVNENVEVVLVSLDFKNQYERRLLPFLKKKQYKSRLIHMTDPKANDWIDKVDPSWEGTIPATLYISGQKRHFVEKAYESYEELNSELESFIQL